MEDKKPNNTQSYASYIVIVLAYNSTLSCLESGGPFVMRHSPIQMVNFKKYKYKKNPWMTQGIMRSIKFRQGLLMDYA